MSDDIGSNPIHFLFFIVNFFVLISSESYTNRNQQCPKSFLCHPTNPRLFLQCVPNVGLVKIECPEGLLFNSVIKACDWPQNSDCALNRRSTPNSLGAATGPTLTSRESLKIEMPDWNNKRKKYNPTNSGTKTTVKTTITWPATPKAEKCNSNSCKLPNCKCPDDSIPGSLKLKTVPQIVLLTFDDGVNGHNIDYYRKMHNQNLTNPDGCPMRLTFFVSGDNTNYQLVKQLYRQGHEIASHSKTHRFPISWWLKASYKNLEDEMVGMRDLLSKRSSIPMEKIKGTRIPFLQLAGDDLYQAIKDNNFLWDSSMVARRYNQPIWPFTLDYRVTFKQCLIERCPKRSFPGLWEVPLIQWSDSDGQIYAMPDVNKKPRTKTEMFNFFLKNFEVHYKTNRAPFGIFLHATWFEKNDFNFRVLQEFLKYLSGKKDVWVIPVSQAIDWVRNPKPMSLLTEIPSWNCSQTI